MAKAHLDVDSLADKTQESSSCETDRIRSRHGLQQLSCAAMVHLHDLVRSCTVIIDLAVLDLFG
jgi:hypothetical protein